MRVLAILTVRTHRRRGHASESPDTETVESTATCLNEMGRSRRLTSIHKFSTRASCLVVTVSAAPGGGEPWYARMMGRAMCSARRWVRLV